jgi:hypothetical protein
VNKMKPLDPVEKRTPILLSFNPYHSHYTELSPSRVLFIKLLYINNEYLFHVAEHRDRADFSEMLPSVYQTTRRHITSFPPALLRKAVQVIRKHKESMASRGSTTGQVGAAVPL